jgi:hypothetical protein
MYLWNDPDDRVAIAQMNSDLRHAQLDLLSAQCATDRLRLRFSAADLARYGERDVLRKAIGTAITLNEYYLSIQNEMPPDATSLSEPQIAQTVKRVSEYLWGLCEMFFAKGAPLGPREKGVLQNFFSPRGMRYLGMKLQSVEFPLRILDRREW